jgi:thiamine-phosphate diphosphorylase
VTDDGVLGRDGWVDLAVGLIEAGGPDLALHIRGPATPPRTLLELAATLMPHAERSGGCLCVNDRVDVGLVAGVHGVHLGRRSMTAVAARTVVGPSKWIGVSRRGDDEAAASAAEGADYVFVGTIFESASHPAAPALGLGPLERAVRRWEGLPVVAIGGIGARDASDVVATGACGVAAIRGIWDAPDPGAAARQYLDGLAIG